jgi:hypothetical protein
VVGSWHLQGNEIPAFHPGPKDTQMTTSGWASLSLVLRISLGKPPHMTTSELLHLICGGHGVPPTFAEKTQCRGSLYGRSTGGERLWMMRGNSES